MENILDNTILEEQNTQIIYGGFGPRLAAIMLDGLIFSPLYIGVFFNMLNWKSSILLILFSLIPLIYKPLWEYKYGATIGKKAMKIRVVNINYQKANLREVLLRNIFYIGLGLTNIILYLEVFAMPDFAYINEFSEYALINKLSTSLIWVSYLSSGIYLVEFIMLLIDEKKRSLHDRIGQTYVIKEIAEWQKRI